MAKDSIDDDNFYYQKQDIGDTPFLEYAFAKPTPGVWKIMLVANANQSNTEVISTVTIVSPIQKVVVDCPRGVYDKGSIATVKATLKYGDKPLTNAIITGEISSRSSGIIDDVYLYDDGNHSDGESGDGIYGGFTNQTGGSEKLTISFVIQGKDSNGYIYKRSEFCSYLAVASAVKFSGVPRFEKVDSDNNGLIESINVIVDIDIDERGTYGVGIGMINENGERAFVGAVSTGYNEGLPGINTIKIAIDFLPHHEDLYTGELFTVDNIELYSEVPNFLIVDVLKSPGFSIQRSEMEFK